MKACIDTLDTFTIGHVGYNYVSIDTLDTISLLTAAIVLFESLLPQLRLNENLEGPQCLNHC